MSLGEIISDDAEELIPFERQVRRAGWASDVTQLVQCSETVGIATTFGSIARQILITHWLKTMNANSMELRQILTRLPQDIRSTLELQWKQTQRGR